MPPKTIPASSIAGAQININITDNANRIKSWLELSNLPVTDQP